MLKARAGIDLLLVPYKGSGPAVTDVIGGQITPEQFAAYIRSEIEKWGRVQKVANIKVE